MNTIQIILVWCFGSTHVKKLFAQLSGYLVWRVRVAPPPPLPFCWCTLFVVSIRRCFLQRSAKDKSLFRWKIYKNNSRMCYCTFTLWLCNKRVHLLPGFEIREYLTPSLVWESVHLLPRKNNYLEPCSGQSYELPKNNYFVKTIRLFNSSLHFFKMWWDIVSKTKTISSVELVYSSFHYFFVLFSI